MLENSERSARGVRMGAYGPLERAELANQIQGFRTTEMLRHWSKGDASDTKEGGGGQNGKTEGADDCDVKTEIS